MYRIVKSRVDWNILKIRMGRERRKREVNIEKKMEKLIFHIGNTEKEINMMRNGKDEKIDTEV